MYWDILKKLSNRFMKIAITAVVIIPFLYELIKKIGIEGFLNEIISTYRIVFLGSVLYFFTYVCTLKFIPEIFKNYKNLNNYVEWCNANAGVFFAKIYANRELFDQVGKLRIKFPDYAQYIPLNRAIKVYQNEEIASAYGDMFYKISNESKELKRWIISIFYIISIAMIFSPQIKRIISFLSSLF
jgi:hypothetical protein